MRRSVLWMRKRTMQASARIIEGTMQAVRALDEEENDAGEFGPHIFLCLFLADPFLTSSYLFDPAAAAWIRLPPLPCSPHHYGLSNFVPVVLGLHLYVLGGSHFDAHSYPLGHPTASAAAHCLDLTAPPSLLAWHRLPNMLSPRSPPGTMLTPASGRWGKGCRGIELGAWGSWSH